jgi:energy-coupling factor transporter ATP-binding protein EcfA2
MDSTENPRSIVEARNLGFQYEGTEAHAIRGVNFSIERGEFVLLAGPSGCGKTTLCRCLNGLIPHFYPGIEEGEILVDGSKVTSLPTSEVSRKVGYVFQNPENQLFALTVEKDVAFGPENLGLSRSEIRERVDWAMGVTGTTELKNFAPYELSGGQQQRVALAGVLAMKPAVVVMDEPTSFLDPVTAEEVMKAVADLRLEHGITVIVVEHRLDLVSRYADRIIVMDSGTVVADGSIQDVLDGQFDQLTGLGVGVPRVSQLWAMLKRDGLVSGQTPKVVEVAAEKLGGKLST